MGDETEKTVKKVENADKAVKGFTARLKDFYKQHVATNKAVVGLSTAMGGLLGGIKGVATAFPLMVSGALAAAPAVVALAGAVGALVSSLGAAVGGGALLGAGLLGSFAVGLGSIAAVAKPAITATQNYEKAVKNLNTAIASGSPTAIKARQQQLDAIAKANPGVAQLAGNLKKFTGEWKKATEPGRASFFKLAAEGIQTLRGLIPTLATETNKNTAALQQSFQKILAPFLDSSTFKGFVSGLGGIFRANLPGFMQGIVNVFKGLADILKVLTPQLDRAGPSFQRFTGSFAKWASSAGGRSTIKEMGRAFSAWLDLLKQIARIIGSFMGAGMGSGTSEVGKWADKMQGFADTLSKPAAKNSMAGFMSRSLDDVNKLWPVLQNLVGALKSVYATFKPLGLATTWLLKVVPGGLVGPLAAGYAAIKGTMGAAAGAKGVWNAFAKARGDTPLNPLFVANVDAPGGGGGGPLGALKRKFGKGKAGEVAAGETVGEDALKVAGEGEGVSALTKLGSIAKVGGKLAGAVGVIVALGSAAEAFASAKGGVGNKAKAAAKALDPTQVLNVVGLPSVTDQLFKKDKPVRIPGIVSATGTPLVSAGQLAQSSGVGYAQAQATISSQSRQASIDTSTRSLVAYAKAVDDVKGHLALLTPKQLDALKSRGDQLAQDKNLTKYKGQVQDLRDSLNHPTTGLIKAVNAVQPAFDYMAKGAGKSLGAITLMSKFAIDQINNTLPAGSKAATDALAANYQVASDDIKASMAKGVIGTQQGINMIAQLMAKAFKLLGISGKVATSLAKEGWSVADVQKNINQGQAAGLTAKGAGAMTSTVGGGSYQYETGGRLPGRPQGDHLPLFGRGGKLLGIADGGELVVNRHTEAKADKMLASFGTRLSDIVDGETKPHFALGGRVGGQRMFQTGGAIPYSGLEGLWDAAGGPKNLAPLMAAIAMAESGGRNVKQAGQPFATTGWGLWQITPGGPQYLDPMTNAREAVAKYRSQNLGAWTTYTSGAYRQFMHGNVPPGAFAGGGGGAVSVPTIKAPRVRGLGGDLQMLGQGVVNNVTTAANAYLQSVAPAAGVSAGAGGPGPAGGPSGVGTYKGIPMANWVIASLQYAASKGVSPQPTSGYRTEAHSAALGFPHDEHTIPGPYPHGAVDFGGMYDPPAYPKKMSVVNATRGFKWPLLAPVGFHDDGHASGTGHALGGRLPWLAQGGDFIARRPQVIGVGDAPGGERVTVTPRGQGGLGNQGLNVTIHKIEVHRKGDIQKIVDEELRLLANTIESHL
jgi:hypothetical protein